VKLAVHDHRIDGAPAVVHRQVAQDPHRPVSASTSTAQAWRPKAKVTVSGAK